MPRTARHRWHKRHQVRHAMSVRAFRWLTERKIIRGGPCGGFVLSPHVLKLAGLPAELAGLRIAHLSDLHVGSLLTPDHLPAIVRQVNALEPDIIAVTGDLMDTDNHYLHPLLEALLQLRAPLGIYSVLGNHDYRDAAPEIVHGFRMADMKMLVDQHVMVQASGRAVAVAGIDWAESDDDLAGHVRKTCAKIQGDDLRILLAHHPHALDAAADAHVHLVLSGHTHGGQFIFRKSRTHQRESVGLGNLKWRYPQGHYQRGDTHLFVTNGLGGSFPLRFRCPAEITLLELQPG
ncbi:MAG: metallophosphoesterase [Phycisphaeraceae bacterium]